MWMTASNRSSMQFKTLPAGKRSDSLVYMQVECSYYWGNERSMQIGRNKHINLIPFEINMALHVENTVTIGSPSKKKKKNWSVFVWINSKQQLVFEN